MKRLTSWLTVALLALTFAACSGSESEGENGDSDNATADQKVVEMTDPQGAVDGYVGALEDAEITTCGNSGDGWTNAGEITNPTGETQDYRVYVSFMNKGDTLGVVQIDVPAVAAGETALWNKHVELNAKDLECVLRVERFAPQQ